MVCFRKTIAVAAIFAMIVSSMAVICQSNEADAADPAYFDAEVTPFTFPDCEGTPILRALEQAEETIDISIYILTSVYILSMLIEKQSQGIHVRILIEGQPIEYDLEGYEGTRIFRNLVDRGGEVHIINYGGCETQTYKNLHNKYAVIDGETVVLTSENWTAANFSPRSENRGWGAAIKSTGYAQYMESVFENDFDESRADVKKFTDVYPGLAPYTKELSYKMTGYSTGTYSAKVSPAITFDNAWTQLSNFISSAGSRLYSEQLNISDQYFSNPVDNPYAWMVTKAETVDTRLVLNTYYDTPDEHKVADMIRDINNGTSIIASGSPETCRLVHNKGLVADDRAWVGSLNWTPESINENREASVIIQSQEVSDFFARMFLFDFYSGYIPDGSRETSKVTYVVDGKETVLNYIKNDKVLLPDDPYKKSCSVYTYSFSHWDGYTDGMVADRDLVLTAEFDKNSALDDNKWYEYFIIILAVIAALMLCTWYVRYRRN